VGRTDRRIALFQNTPEGRGVINVMRAVRYAVKVIALDLFTPVQDESLQCFDAVGWASGRASGL